MKRTLLSLALGLVLCASAWAQNAPKYVFYFIGDGMGVNQVNAAETFGAAIEGSIGIKPLIFPSFPHVALVNTQSASHGITDSAAGPAYFTMPPDRSHPHLKSLYLGVSCLNFYSGPTDLQWEATPLEAVELLGYRLAGV